MVTITIGYRLKRTICVIEYLTVLHLMKYYEQMQNENLGEIINNTLKIEEVNKPMLNDIFTVDFNNASILGDTNPERNEMLKNLLSDFAKVDLKNIGKTDLLGKAYMYLIKQFASKLGKKAGEFFTPDSVSILVSKLAMPKEGNKICDPTCGSGSLLLRVGDEVEAIIFLFTGRKK